MRIAFVLVVALTIAATAAAATQIRATLNTSTTTPVVDERWRWTVTVKDEKGRPIAARVRLQILFAGTVVGCWKRGAMQQCSGPGAGSWISVRGKRTGVLRWPAQSLGVKLTFQAVVAVADQTLRLKSPVRVRPKI